MTITADTIRGVRARSLQGETARTILAELEKKFPALASEASIDDEEGRVWFETSNWHKDQLITRVGWYLGCKAFSVKGQKGTLLRGPKSLLAAVEPIVATLWKKLLEVHKGATMGFLMGALPPDKSILESISQKPEHKESKPLSPSAAAALVATLNIGRDAMPRQALPEKTR